MSDPRIDLHTHSTASDGTDTPAQLMAAAATAGLSVVALTDHDGTGGWAEAAAALPPGLTLLPGVELSAAADVGGRRVPLHLLGYLIDPAHPGFVAETSLLRESRVRRARGIVEALRADGHPVSWERIVSRSGDAVGRPHIAAELVELGLIETVARAFTDDWIGSAGRYYRADRKIEVIEAVCLVVAAGGVPVFAHPGAAGRGDVVPDATIEAMCGAGLVGLEVDHPDHDPVTRRRLRGLAADLDLLVTGSSDYHGTSKPTGLGANLTRPEVYEDLIARATGSVPVTPATTG